MQSILFSLLGQKFCHLYARDEVYGHEAGSGLQAVD